MAVTGSAASGALSRLAGLLPVEVCGLSDQQLVSFAGQLSAARRQVESLELAVAAEFGRRSNGAARGESLANRLGVRTAAQAVEAVTGSSASAAQRLVKDAEAFATLPAVEEAVLAGRIGRESAQAIAGELSKTASAVDAAQLAQAGWELVALAQTQSVDRVREEAQRKVAALTPQFVEDRAKKAMADRFLWIGPVRNGAAKVSGLLPAGHAAVITGLFDAYANPRATVRFASSDEGDEQPRDARTAGQKRADLFRDVCAAQARSAHAPELGGDHPTVWVSTTARELSAGAGMAFYAGVSEPVPVTDAEQAACTGGILTVVFDDGGRVLRLGRRARGFTRRQRRAIALRDGGSCLIPGCTTPAQWCETHHVTPWSGGGKTDVDNGVNLCWFHHHEIDTGPWRVRMRDGRPEVRHRWAGRDSGWRPPEDHGGGAFAGLRDAGREPSDPAPQGTGSPRVATAPRRHVAPEQQPARPQSGNPARQQSGDSAPHRNSGLAQHQNSASGP